MNNESCTTHATMHKSIPSTHCARWKVRKAKGWPYLGWEVVCEEHVQEWFARKHSAISDATEACQFFWDKFGEYSYLSIENGETYSFGFTLYKLPINHN